MRISRRTTSAAATTTYTTNIMFLSARHAEISPSNKHFSYCLDKQVLPMQVTRRSTPVMSTLAGAAPAAPRWRRSAAAARTSCSWRCSTTCASQVMGWRTARRLAFKTLSWAAARCTSVAEMLFEATASRQDLGLDKMLVQECCCRSRELGSRRVAVHVPMLCAETHAHHQQPQHGTRKHCRLRLGPRRCLRAYHRTRRRPS